jgi:hypothetical protein
MSDVEALDLSRLVVHFPYDLLRDMNWGEGEQSDVEFQRDGQEARDVLLVLVLVMAVPA